MPTTTLQRPQPSDACTPAAAQQQVRILHADASLLVLDKPAGLLCVPGRGADGQDCLSRRMQQQWPDALVVHRLDMATSGLVLMARGADAQRVLSFAFAARLVEKRYIAIVDGVIPAAPDVWHRIELPLMPDWPHRPRQKVDTTHGKPSLTFWRCLHSDAKNHCSRLELRPVTGRSHQLRVHLRAIGHPILGDALYASESVQARADRLLLHASELTLPHPESTEVLSWRSKPAF